MMRFPRILIIAALAMLVGLRITLAQTDGVMQLGGYLDQQATANGLSLGDGNVSSVEQSVASALIDEITGFSQSVTNFEQANPANKTWLDNIEQRTTTYNQQMEAAGDDAPFDVRADIISNAVAQYGKDVTEVQAQDTYDVRAQIISEAVEQYGKDASDLQAEAPFDPRADAIAQAVAQYGQQLPPPPFDPRADAIAQAVAQYGQEISQTPSSTEAQAINKSLRDGTRQYINNSSIPRKVIVIRHIDEMLPSDFDNKPDQQSDLLPGYYRKARSTTTITGTCAAQGVGHNPEGGGGIEPTPVIPTVPIFQTSAGDFLVIDGYAYAKLQPQTYGHSDSSRQLGMTTSGATKAVNTTRSIEYQIVSPSLIAIHRTYHEEGGCTVASDSKYELVKTDATVVTNMVQDIVYPQPTSTPIPADSTPVAPVQPIPPGSYPITWTVDSGTCTDKTQPTFTEAQIDYANNGDMLLRLGDDTHTLFALGDQDHTHYQLVSSERQITVQVIGDAIKMDWGKFAGMSMCFKGGELRPATSSSSPSAPDSPAVIPTATPIAAASGQGFQVSFKPDETTCPDAVRSQLPNFDGATFEALPDGGYQLTVAGETLAFKDQYGFATYDGSMPAKGITYQISAQIMGQNGMLGLTYMTNSGQMCLAQMTLSPR